MANRHETTFAELQVDERFKKLQRSLKLDLLRQEHGRSVQDGKASSVTTWPSISSINVDTLDSSCAPPSLQTSLIKSEVLASSNNLRNILLRKKNHNINQEIMTTSSVKQYHVQQDSPVDRLVMPPPSGSTVYRAFKEPQDRVRTSSNCEKAAPSLLNRSVSSSTVNTFSLKSVPSWISTNTNSGKEYPNTFVTPATPINNFQKIDRVFSKWKVMLNDQYELIIKGTLEDKRVARSKPVIRRYSATCVESKYKHKYILQGNIVDERNGLPDYIRGKFYNGFPDDWENVYQIWRTYVSKGCPLTFRWPTPITDSDDDLKSELTDLTYTCMRNKTIPSTESCNLNEYTKTEKDLNNTSERKEKHNYSNTYNSQNYEKNASFVKPFISNSEKDIIPIEQTKNIKSLYDEDNKQNVKSEINPSCSSRKVNKLKDIFQEDKLNIIINNLADRNCSPKYIDKIIEMFDCLDYVVSYRTESECNNDSVITSQETSKSESIPMQQNLRCDDNCTNTNKLEDKLTELKNYGHSTDLGYGSIRNDSNAIQLSNPEKVKPEDDKDSDKLESETYAGVPKISIERILKIRDTSRKIYKRKVRKKMVCSNAENHATNLPYDTEEIKFESVHVENPITNTKKNLPPDESCVSITEDEVEIISTKECRQTIDVTQRPQEMSVSGHREIQRNNFELYGKGKSVTHVQNEQPFDAFEAQRVNLNVFIKEQKIPYRVQENAHSQFIADVDYTTNSDIDVVTVSTSTRKTDRTDGNMIAPRANVDQDIVISSENNSDFHEKPRATPKLRREFIEQTKSEVIKKSKPTIISSVPVNLNLRISRADPKARQLHDPNIIAQNEDKQDANIQPLEETDKKKTILKTSIVKKSVINDSHSKATVDNKREVCPTTNNKNELDNINPANPTTNSTTKQSKSNKRGVEENPKVLTAWMPKVVYYTKSKSELGLTFQGKLLNEAGHVVHRSFTTDVVLRRLSLTLIETVNHEFYELLGHLKDNKHVIPKELVRQCRYGCPAKIEQFCLTWKALHDNVQEVGKKLHDATMDSLNAPVSSRGRHIVPPLSYWIGERITLKDNNLVYSPGNSQESSLLSLTDNSKEIQKNDTNTENRKKQKMNSENTSKKQSINKPTLLPESNKIPGTNKNQTIVIEKARVFKKSPKIESRSTHNTRSDNSKKFRKSVKQRLAKKLTFSSTDSSEEEQKASPRKRMRNSQTNGNADPETPSQYTMTLRKRQKIEASSNRRTSRRDSTKSRYYTAYYSPTKRSKNEKMTYTYYQGVPQSENFLSENEVSSV